MKAPVVNYEILGTAAGDTPQHMLGFWAAMIPEFLKAGVDSGLAINKAVQDKQAQDKAEAAAASAVQASIQADLKAKNALAQSLYAAQLAKQARAAAEADPGNPNKQSAKTSAEQKAQEADSNAQAALSQMDALGHVLPSNAARIAASETLFNKAQETLDKAKKDATKVQKDPKKYPAAYAIAQFAQANAQAANEIRMRITTGKTEKEEPKVVEIPKEGFLERKIAGPITGKMALLGGIFVALGGSAFYFLRKRS